MNPITENSTDAEIDAAIEASKDAPTPRGANRATYDPAFDTIIVGFAEGTELRIPRRLLYELDKVTNAFDLSTIELEGLGTVLWWPRLEVGHAVSDLERGLYGPPAWLRSLGIVDARIAPPEAA